MPGRGLLSWLDRVTSRVMLSAPGVGSGRQTPPWRGPDSHSKAIGAVDPPQADLRRTAGDRGSTQGDPPGRRFAFGESPLRIVFVGPPNRIGGPSPPYDAGFRPSRLCHNGGSQGIMSGWIEMEPTARRSTRHSGGSRNPETLVHQAYVRVRPSGLSGTPWVRADFSFHVNAD